MTDLPAKHGNDHGSRGTDPVSLAVVVPYKVFRDDQVCTTGDGKLIDMIELDLDTACLTFVEIFLTTSGSGTTTVQIRNVTQAHDFLSTAVTIDSGELRSKDAATPFVISASNADVAHGDLIAIDVDGVASGSKGLGVKLTYELGVDPTRL